MSGPSGILVAPKKLDAAENRGGCDICALAPDVYQQVNAAIWTPERTRTRDYRKAGMAVLSTYGKDVNPKLITRHAEHIERSWRVTTEPSGSDRAVFPAEFEGYAGRIAEVGGKAAEALERHIASGYMKETDLIAATRLGLMAQVARQRAADMAAARALKSGARSPQAIAIFGIVSGHLDTPQGEVKNVTPIAELMDELRVEREQLSIASGHAEAEDDAIDEALG